MQGKLYLGECDYEMPGEVKNKAYITWELKEKEVCKVDASTIIHWVFSAQGEIWNKQRTDIVLGGQCLEALAKLFPAHGKAQKIIAVWRRWHLNDMRAGCEHQRAGKWDEKPIDPTRPCDTSVTLKAGEHGLLKDHTGWNMLTWVKQDEHPDGLLCRPCPVCGYKYGTEWLYEAIPEDVLEEIKSWSV